MVLFGSQFGGEGEGCICNIFHLVLKNKYE